MMSISLSVMKLQISVFFLEVPTDLALKRKREKQRLWCARVMKGNGNKVSCIGTREVLDWTDDLFRVDEATVVTAW